MDYFHFSLLGKLEIHGFKISNDPSFGDKPMGALEELYCTFDPLSLASDAIHIHRLRIEKPEFRLSFNSEKDSNIYCGRKKEHKATRDREDDSNVRRVFELVRVDTLEINGGLFEFNYDPSDLTVTTPYFSFNGAYNRDTHEMNVTGNIRDVRTTLRDRLDVTGTIDLAADVWGDGVHDSKIQTTTQNGKTSIDGSCRLAKFTNPRLDFQGDVQTDLEEVASVLSLSVSMNGVMSGAVEGTGLARDLQITAQMHGSDLILDRLKISHMDAAMLYRDRVFSISPITGMIYNGRLRASGNINVGPDDKSLYFSGEINDFDTKLVCEEQSVPLLMPGSGQMSITVKAPSFNPQDVIVEGVLSAYESPDSLDNSQMSLAATYRYEEKAVTVQRASIIHPAFNVDLLNGKFTGQSITGDVNVTAMDIKPMTRRISAFFYRPLEIPHLSGSLSAALTLHGSPRQYSVDFKAASPDFVYNTIQPAQMTCQGRVDRQQVDLKALHLANDDLSVDGYLTVGTSGSIRERIKQGNLSFSHLDLAELENQFNLGRGLAGDATGHIQFGCDPGSSSVSELRIENLVAYKIDLGTCDLRFRYCPDGIFDIDVSGGASPESIKFRGNLPLDAPQEWVLSAENFQLSRLNRAQPIPLEGQGTILCTTHPDPVTPLAQFEFFSPQINIREKSFELIQGRGILNLGENPFVRWDLAVNSTHILSTGTVRIQDDFPLTMEIELSNQPIEHLIAASPIHQFQDTVQGTTSAYIHLNWSVKDPLSVDLNGTASALKFNVSGQEFTILEPTDFKLLGEKITVSPTRLEGKNTTIDLSGSIDFAGSIDFSLGGRVDLSGMSKISDLLKDSRGRALFDLNLQGPVGNPEINGVFTIEELYFFNPLFNVWIEDLHSEIAFRHNLGNINYCDGLAGGSLLSIQGDFGVKQFLPNLLDLKIQSDNVEFQFPEDFKSQGDVELNLTGSLANPLISGTVNLDRTLYNQRINYKSMIIEESSSKLRLKQRPVASRPVAQPVFNPSFQIKITGEDNIVIDNNLLKTEMKLGLDLQGKLSKPEILGEIESINGTLEFQSREFEIQRAILNFSSPEAIDPILDFSAVSNIGEYQITVEVTGPIFKNFYINTYSVPALNDLDIWSLLAIGKTTEQLTENSADVVASGVSYLTFALQDELEKRFKTWMGFDEFSIDPVLSTTDENPSARFTVKKNFSPELAVTYSRSVTATGDLLILEYKLSDNLFLVGQKLEDGSVGGDLRFRWEFR